MENDSHFNDYLNAKDNKGSSLLHFAVALHNRNWNFDKNKEIDSIKLAKYLIAKNPNLTKAVDELGFNPLHAAACFLDTIMVNLLLTADDSAVNTPYTTPNQATPLHLLTNSLYIIHNRWKEKDQKKEIEARYLFALKILVKHGGNLRLPAGNGHTALDMLSIDNPPVTFTHFRAALDSIVCGQKNDSYMDDRFDTFMFRLYTENYENLKQELKEADAIPVPKVPKAPISPVSPAQTTSNTQNEVIVIPLSIPTQTIIPIPQSAIQRNSSTPQSNKKTQNNQKRTMNNVRKPF